MSYGISEHVAAWLEDDCDRTDIDFILDGEADDYGDELLNQSAILPANETEQQKETEEE